MSTALVIGGIALGAAVLVGVAMMGKKREPTEDTGFGVENQASERIEGGKSRRRRTRSRRSRRVKI